MTLDKPGKMTNGIEQKSAISLKIFICCSDKD